MNRLAQQTSPYLLQHANNPVDWYPWGEEALGKAISENKPILVSIGYSACHWCHVMEHESFEKEDVAKVMNEHFICIKVDREERPDVDAVYMDAVQAMGVRGGWPLNVFLLPDTRPFYGVTYLPTQNWIQLLGSVNNAFTGHYDELARSAAGFVDNMVQSESQKYGLAYTAEPFTPLELDAMFEKLKQNFDDIKGGMNRAPKFPMPSIYKFLLRYYDLTQHPEALAQLELSLDRIALGGIYDHVGGGWARYSVDDEWFIPHFEKMLYDNAQLLSVYAEAFSLTMKDLYHQRLTQTIQWLTTDMLSPEGGFYSALDADSEGIEGKFYIWTQAELKSVLGEDFGWFSRIYNISENGNWEHGFNHLHLSNFLEATAKEKGLQLEDLLVKHDAALQKLFSVRAFRSRPGLDDKILASWNGLLIKGLCDTYRALGDEHIRTLAVNAGTFISQKMTGGKQLFHSFKAGKATVTGFLEDYAAVTEAYISLYQITFQEHWLEKADALTAYTISNFFNHQEGYFNFSDKDGEKLIAQKREIFDNVIPASNSIMAHNLHQLGMLLDRKEYMTYSEEMLSKMRKIMMADVQWVTNWAALYCLKASPTAEVVIVGEDCEDIRKDFDRFFIPNKVVLGTSSSSKLPLLAHRSDMNGKTAIYICYDKACQLPVTTVEDALNIIVQSSV